MKDLDLFLVIMIFVLFVFSFSSKAEEWDNFELSPYEQKNWAKPYKPFHEYLKDRGILKVGSGEDFVHINANGFSTMGDVCVTKEESYGKIVESKRLCVLYVLDYVMEYGYPPYCSMYDFHVGRATYGNCHYRFYMLLELAKKYFTREITGKINIKRMAFSHNYARYQKSIKNPSYIDYEY